MSLEPGQIIENKYRIVKLIGEGGMGAVYEGENARIRRRVAIKVLHSALSANVELMERFEREAQAAGRIGNDHILEVLDLGELHDGSRYMVMEFLEGEPLSKRIETAGRLTAAQIVPLVRQVLEGLGAAHNAGIVHRDLKPDNLYILTQKAGTRDYVKIIDFGISKFQPLNNDGMKVTKTGVVMGTPYYMSPEQASGSREADARSDLYAMGVILYEAVTGRVPFDATSFNQLLFQIVLAEPPPLRQVNPELDDAFASVVSKAMARDPAHRFQTAHEFIAALDNWAAQGHGVSVPPAGAAHDALPPGARPSTAMVGTPATGAQVPTPAGVAPAGTPAHGSHGMTSGSWASSQPGFVPMKRSNAPVIAAVIASGLVLAGGVAVAMFALGSQDEGAPAPSAVAAEAHPPAAAAPAPSPAVMPTPPSAEPHEAEKPPEPPKEATKPTETKTPTKSAPRKSAPAKSAPAPAPAPKKTAKSSGDDFGY